MLYDPVINSATRNPSLGSTFDAKKINFAWILHDFVIRWCRLRTLCVNLKKIPTDILLVNYLRPCQYIIKPYTAGEAEIFVVFK